MPHRRDSDVTPTPPGAIVGHYEILGELGRGGMGVLYRARDQRLGRVVALKRPSAPGVLQRQRFEREARAAAQLAHPHIVPIFEVLEDDGVPWIAMELVEGRSLRSLLDLGEPLPLAELLRHAEGLAGALQAAHARGILHRDVNPKNVMVTPDGRALLTDFGLARVSRESSSDTDSTDTQENDVTRAGSVLGTPGYMSPEQALGRPADARSDLFCLGAVVYEMCTRTRAFSASDTGSALDAVLHRDPPAVTLCRKDCPPELERIVRKLLSKDAADRYQNAGDAAADLRALRRQIEWERYGSGASGTGRTAVRRPAPIGRPRALATAVALVAILGATAMLWPRTGGPIAFSERDWIVVAEIDNQSGDPLFDQTLREGLIASLSQSAHVNVLPDLRIAEALKRMRRSPETPLSPAVAREIAEREGARAVLSGSIKRLGNANRLTVQVSDRRGGVMLSEHETFTHSQQLFASVDALATRVRARLGESLGVLADSRVPLELATTSSLEALRFYSAARQAHRIGDLAGATANLKQAVALDPLFATAHARLADAYVVGGNNVDAIASYAEAQRLSSNTATRERLLIASKYESSRGHYENAADNLRALTALYPDDQGAHHALALAYESLGQKAEAIAEVRECLRLDPHDRWASGNLPLMLATWGQEDEALRAFAATETAGGSSTYSHWGVGLARMARGDFDGASTEFSRLEAAGPPYAALGRLNLSRIDVAAGRWSAAIQQLPRDVGAYRANSNLVFAVLSQEALGRVLMQTNKRNEARREINAILAESDEVLRANELRVAGSMLAQIGEPGEARRVLSRLRRVENVQESAAGRRSISMLEGEIALAEGRLGNAEESFASALAGGAHYAALLGMARTYQQRKDWKQAAKAWQSVIEARGEILRYGFPADWCLAHFERAEALRQAGEGAEALKAYERFRELWSNAEPSRQMEAALRHIANLKAST